MKRLIFIINVIYVTIIFYIDIQHRYKTFHKTRQVFPKTCLEMILKLSKYGFEEGAFKRQAGFNDSQIGEL